MGTKKIYTLSAIVITSVILAITNINSNPSTPETTNIVAPIKESIPESPTPTVLSETSQINPVEEQVENVTENINGEELVEPSSTITPTPITTPLPPTKPSPTRVPAVKPTNVQIAESKLESVSKFECNCSKTCPNISSCAEAQFLLNECGCNARDADDDGIACDGRPLNCQK